MKSDLAALNRKITAALAPNHKIVSNNSDGEKIKSNAPQHQDAYPEKGMFHFLYCYFIVLSNVTVTCSALLDGSNRTVAQEDVTNRTKKITIKATAVLILLFIDDSSDRDVDRMEPNRLISDDYTTVSAFLNQFFVFLDKGVDGGQHISHDGSVNADS